MDTSKLRENDKPYVNEVVQYLEKRGLVVELRGSASEGKEDYQDIDLFAKGGLEAVTDVISGLEGSRARTTPFPETSANGEKYTVINLDEDIRYMREHITQRFKIKVDETEIDLGLKVNKIRLDLQFGQKVILGYEKNKKGDSSYTLGLETRF